MLRKTNTRLAKKYNAYKLSILAFKSYAFRFYMGIIIGFLLIWTLLAISIFEIITRNSENRILGELDEEIQLLASIRETQGEQAFIESVSSIRYSYSLYSYYYLYADAQKNHIAGDILKWPDILRTKNDISYFDIPIKSYFEPERGTTHLMAKVHQFEDGRQLLVANSTRIFSVFQQSFYNGGIIALSIATPLGVISAFFTAFLTQRELDSFNRSIRRIMAGDLNERIKVDAIKIESKEMAENLNAMLDKICLLMEDVRRVSDNIAHDLNTPLARLRNDIKKLIQQSSNDRKPELEALLVECNDILETFSSLLLVAKIESGGASIDKQPLDLETVVLDVVDLYEPLAESKNIKISSLFQGDRNVVGDRNLLFQIIANIVDNSIKYSNKDGEITISLKRGIVRSGSCALDTINNGSEQELDSSITNVSEYESQNYLSVVISDQGIGLPASSHKKIFQRFYREEKSRSLKPGNGLGLSMVMAVMQIHKGAIYVDSLNPGLSIALVFPASTLAAYAPAIAS